MSRVSSLSLLSALCLSFTSALAAIGPVADLTISNADIAPDGYTRAAIVVNGQYPGPLITGNKGDTFMINVIDQLTNTTMLKSTTVHWHGIAQQGTNWADGPAFVNQCPIASGDSFLYQFSAPDQAGTFWYHSHHSTQYADGLVGPIVVYDPDDPHADLYDVDNESTVITLSDWYHVCASLGPSIPHGTDATLFNGLGRYTGGPSTDLAVVGVTQGMRYRFRLVCTTSDVYYTFSIDGHDMTIIEVEGTNYEPLTIDELAIHPGQRYSFVLTADQEIDNYWMRAVPNKGSTSFVGGINSAILRYDGAPQMEPTTNQTNSTAAFNETALVTLNGLPAPGEAFAGGVDYALNLHVTFNGSNYFVNNASYVSPTVPVLLQLMSGASSAADLLPSGSIYTLPANSTIELSFPMTGSGAAGAPHPIHLHGHSFAVVRSAGTDAYNYVNPPIRDCVSTGTTGDNVTIRFRTDNPGPWFLHCHIDYHLGLGFAVVFVEDEPAVSNFTTTEAWDNLCPTYDKLDSSDQ